MFVNGDLVFGGKADVAVTTSRQQCTDNAQQQQQQEEKAATAVSSMHTVSSAAAAATAANDQAQHSSSCSSGDEDDDAGMIQLPAAVSSMSTAREDVAYADHSSFSVSSPTWRFRRSNISELLLQLQEFPQQQQQLSRPPPVAAAAAVAHDKELLLCRVLSSILNASGVLPALLRVQMLDRIDIEGIEPLYMNLMQQQQQQQQRVLGSSSDRAEQLALLRDYLTAATAKDCAIMITMQQIIETQQQQQSPETDGLTKHSSSDSGSSSGNGVITDDRSGCTFAWQISLVDLDLKPLSKVPHHAALDRRIVATAMQHEELLMQQLASRQRWLDVWMQECYTNTITM